MLQGFNEDVQFRGVRYHIQTEDGGLQRPFITTTVFQGGRVVATEKTGYADILRFERLEEAVAQIMQEQHLKMKEALLSGRLTCRSLAGHKESQQGQPSIDELILKYLSIED